METLKHYIHNYNIIHITYKHYIMIMVFIIFYYNLNLNILDLLIIQSFDQ